MISFKSVFYIIGFLALGLGAAMGVCALVDALFQDHGTWSFVVSALITLFVGCSFILSCHQKTKMTLSQRDVFILTSLSWGVLSLLSAFPFIFLEFGSLSLTDGVFEAVSGLTTTGATVMQGLSYAPKGILLWRSLLQWFGGIGIILMAMSILPLLHIGGMQLFKSESSDQTEKIMPRVSQIAASIFKIYAVLTVICAVLLWVAGMTPFEAVCHAFSTLSTGGFSTQDQSIGGFDNQWIEGILILFMFLGGCTILLIRAAFYGDVARFFKDPQIRLFLYGIVGGGILVSISQVREGEAHLWEALPVSLFHVVSFLSTTGYFSGDYMVWGPIPVVLTLLMSVSGACTGSTAGGLKLFRLHAMGSLALAQLRKLRRPHGVFLTKYGGRPISEHLFMSLVAFVALYFFTVAVISLSLSVFGLDALTCVSASISAVSNVGPGIGTIIGPSGTFAPLPDGAKWILSFGMIAGRLELLTVFVLFVPSFWKA